MKLKNGYEPLRVVYAEMDELFAGFPHGVKIRLGRDEHGLILETYDESGIPVINDDGDCDHWEPSFHKMRIDEDDFRAFCAQVHAALDGQATGTCTIAKQVHMTAPAQKDGE